MLGDKIDVSTRHIDAPRGIHFSAALDSEYIQLNKSDRPVGTTITIYLKPNIADKLDKASMDFRETANDSREGESIKVIGDVESDEFEREKDSASVTGESLEMEGTPEPHAHWRYDDHIGWGWDWYCSNSPSLKRVVFAREVEQKFAFSPDLQDDPNWSRINHLDYEGVFWSYIEAPFLIVNGIVIPGFENTRWHQCRELNHPHLQILDPNGNLPLNLQRTALQCPELPFFQELWDDVVTNYCAFALTRLPIVSESIAANLEAVPTCISPHLYRFHRHNRYSEWFVTRGGIGMLHPIIMRAAACASLAILRVSPNSPSYSVLNEDLHPDSAYVFLDDDRSLLYPFDCWIKEIATLPYGDENAFWEGGRPLSFGSFIGQFCRTGTRLMVPKKAVERFTRSKTAGKVWRFEKELEWTKNGWSLFAIGDCGECQFPFLELANKSPPANETDSFAECYLGVDHHDHRYVDVAKAWLEQLGQPLIPHKSRERADVLERAGTTLKNHVERIRRALSEKRE